MSGKPCNLGVGCDEAGVCYASAHGQPEQCGRSEGTAINACPFCGAPGYFVKLAWRVKCTRPSCGAEGGKFESSRDGIRAWNNRAHLNPHTHNTEEDQEHG